MIVRRHLTAISSRNPSAPTTWAYEAGYLTGHVYDYGSGRGRDSMWLASQGLQVSSYDPYYLPEGLLATGQLGNVSVILINYVLNVIESPMERNNILQFFAKESENNTLLIISVRTMEEIEKSASQRQWVRYGDGYLTSRATFQKGYTTEEFTGLCNKLGILLAINRLHTGCLVACVKIRRDDIHPTSLTSYL